MKILIFSHLTPRLQELLYLAKLFKEQGSYKYGWAKDTAIFLRKSYTSRVTRLNTVQDLNNFIPQKPAEQIATNLPLIAPKVKR